MNRSKIIGSTALASVMAASAAHAEMSISGLFAGTLSDSDGGGLASGYSTNSIYVNYSDSMDNGMGVAVAMSLADGGNITTGVSFDTGMGTIGLGEAQDSAMDKNDGSPACYSIILCGAAYSTYTATAADQDTITNSDGYLDGDVPSGNSISYTNTLGGIGIHVTRGMEDATYDPVMSYAASASIMGATIKAGLSAIDFKATATADRDPTFVTVAYSLAGLNLGYAVYDSDNGTEETQMGVGTSMMGMDVGVTFAEADSDTDVDFMRVSASKSLGAASFGVDFTETDSELASNADDSDAWQFTYVVGF